MPIYYTLKREPHAGRIIEGLHRLRDELDGPDGIPARTLDPQRDERMTELVDLQGIDARKLRRRPPPAAVKAGTSQRCALRAHEHECFRIFVDVRVEVPLQR